MLSQFQQQLKGTIESALKESRFPGLEMPLVELDAPTVKDFGDYSTNIAMKAARVLRKSPLALAQDFAVLIQAALKEQGLDQYVSAVKPIQPGFINFYLSAKTAFRVLEDVLAQGESYGRSSAGNNQRVQIEFVSANPTGPLTIAHARQAVVGDVLANILNFTGAQAQREYYVNDGGNQITILGRSIEFRMREILGETIDFPPECYQGAYIKDMARIFMERNGVTRLDQVDQFPDKVMQLRKFGATYLLEVIQQELKDLGVHFDIWTYESQVADKKTILAVLDELQQKGFLYEKDGALWFASTRLGDDKDRVVRKSDGLYTYLTPDIAYHKNKYSRGFDKVYNIWGPDHHGYIPRIKAAVQALGYDRDALEVLIVQLATVYRNGQPVSMSTRKGEFISLREVLDEVGKDATRFFFLMRGISAPLDFDLDLAKKETSENPVYYIQYAHARIYSIVEKAKENQLFAQANNFCLLKEEEELDLIKKIGSFQEQVELCARQMEPFPLVMYVQELANCFHRFYDHHRVVDPSNKELSQERLALIEAARIVLANGLRLFGVSAPTKM